MFCYSILLRPVTSCMASMNSTCICEFDELCGHIFTFLVILQFFGFRIEFIFRSSLEKFKGFKSLAFTFKAHCSSVGCCIIKEYDPVAICFTCGNWERTMQIG